MNNDSTVQFQVGSSVALTAPIHGHGFRRNYYDAPVVTVYEAGAMGTITEARLRDNQILYTVEFAENKKQVGGITAENLTPVEFISTTAQSVFRVDNRQVQQDLREAWSQVMAHPGGPMPDHLRQLQAFIEDVQKHTEPRKGDELSTGAEVVGRERSGMPPALPETAFGSLQHEWYILVWKQERWW